MEACILTSKEITASKAALELVQRHFRVAFYEDFLENQTQPGRDDIQGVLLVQNNEMYIHIRDEHFISSFPNLKIVASPTVGISHIDVAMLRRRNVAVSRMPHHHSTNSYEPIRFLQTSQNRLINIHRKSLKHISQSALFGFSKNIGHDQIWYENSVVFKAVQWLFMIKERSCKLCYIVDSLVKT